jgi:hypothetical protein
METVSHITCASQRRSSRRGRLRRRAIRGAVTIDEILGSIIWLVRDRPEALQAVLRHRDRLYRGLLRQLKSACDANEAGAR